jgi:integrase
VCDRFVAWCSKKVIGESVDDITAHIAFSFIESLDVSNKRKQNIAGDLSACWNMLLRAGLASQNPWKLARPRANLAEAKHGTAFSRDEVARIIDESRRFAHIDNNGRVSEERVAPRNTWLTTAIYIAVYTGLRQNDVFALEWKDISEDISIIDIIPSKTSRFKRRVVIPIHPVLVTYLRQLERGEGSIVKAPHRPEYAWNLCVKRAGIVRGEHELTTFHSLRHTFATWCRESGADKGEQMLLGGWSNVATANRYDHDVSRLTQIVNGLPTV